jgi:hypothetical protein
VAGGDAQPLIVGAVRSATAGSLVLSELNGRCLREMVETAVEILAPDAEYGVVAFAIQLPTP